MAGSQHNGRVDSQDLVRGGPADQLPHPEERDKIVCVVKGKMYIGFMGAADNKLYDAYLESLRHPPRPPPLLVERRHWRGGGHRHVQ